MIAPAVSLAPTRLTLQPAAVPAKSSACAATSLDRFVPAEADSHPVGSRATAVPQGIAGRLGAYAANAGLSLAGGLMGGMALGALLGLGAGPGSMTAFLRLGSFGGMTLGTAGGVIGSGIKAHQTGVPFQPGRALEVGAISGAVGTVAALGVVLLALHVMT